MHISVFVCHLIAVLCFFVDLVFNFYLNFFFLSFCFGYFLFLYNLRMMYDKYSSVFPFMSIAPKYLTDAKGIKDGGPDVSLVYLMSAIISPFLGRAVDYFG